MPIFTGEAWGWGYDRYVWFNTAIRPDRIRHVIALPVEVVGCRILVRWMFPKIGFHMANTCAMVQGYNTVSKDLLRIETVEIRNRLSHWCFALRYCSKWNSSVIGGILFHKQTPQGSLKPVVVEVASAGEDSAESPSMPGFCR